MKRSMILFLIIITSIVMLFQCADEVPEKIEQTILAKVGDKVITEDEFIRRAEYTMRPPYCRGDNYIHRKIVLNSLIAEKLFALESGAPQELLTNEQYQDYIQGRKEQTMLQLFYHDQAYDKVKLDTSEYKKMYKLAGREYEISYFSVTDENRANLFMNELNKEDITLESIFEYYFNDPNVPKQKVSWQSKSDDPIQRALFKDVLNKGDIIGPLYIRDGDYYLIIRIDGWVDRPAITDTQIRTRSKDVREKLTDQQAIAIYKEVVAEIMRGKKLEFSNASFNRVAEYLAPFYLKSEEEKQEEFNKRFWEKEKAPDTTSAQIEDILEDPMLRIDGETWTVKRFFKEMAIHPLVFRKRNISNSEFPAQLRLAIADMVQDKYVVQEAYKKGMDESIIVKQNVSMWDDNLRSLYHKNHYLKSNGAEGIEYTDAIETYLDPYVDSLQTKYNDQIFINTDAFENIKLTNIDMFVIQKNVPFPIIVPGFPLLTTDNALDYGSILEVDKKK